jgi:hypothetical protein
MIFINTGSSSFLSNHKMTFNNRESASIPSNHKIMFSNTRTTSILSNHKMVFSKSENTPILSNHTMLLSNTVKNSILSNNTIMFSNTEITSVLSNHTILFSSTVRTSIFSNNTRMFSNAEVPHSSQIFLKWNSVRNVQIIVTWQRKKRIIRWSICATVCLRVLQKATVTPPTQRKNFIRSIRLLHKSRNQAIPLLFLWVCTLRANLIFSWIQSSINPAHSKN